MVIVVSLLGALLLFFLQRAIYRRFWLRGLDTRLSFQEETIEGGGDAVIVETTSNRKALPLPLYEYSYTIQKSFSVLKEGKGPLLKKTRLGLKGKSRIIRKTKIEGLKRGVYTINDGRIDASDLFFSLSLRSPLFSDTVLTVLPEKLETEDIQVPFRMIIGQILSKRVSNEDPFEVRNIRPYEIYDSQRSINWKASAKTGDLKVNTYAYTTSEEVTLILDLSEGNEEEREKLISVASSLALRFLNRGVSVSLVSNGRSCFMGRRIVVPVGTGFPHSRTIDKALSEMKVFSTTEDTVSSMVEECTGVPVLVAKKASPVASRKNEKEFAFVLDETNSFGWEICFIGGRDD